MKNLVMMSALALSIVVGGTVEVLAASERGGARHSFEELDANSDGQVSQAEFAAHRAERFETADANGDGQLSRDEILARGKARDEARAERRADKMLERLDANKDGALTLAELNDGRGGKLFDRADSDGNGAVSKAEFDQMKEHHKERKKSKN